MPVDVVDLLVRPAAGSHQENDAMYLEIDPGFLVGLAAGPRDTPEQLTGSPVISEQLEGALRCQPVNHEAFAVSHGAAPV